MVRAINHPARRRASASLLMAGSVFLLAMEPPEYSRPVEPAARTSDSAEAADLSDEQPSSQALAPPLPETGQQASEALSDKPVVSLREALEKSYWANPALLAERARLRSIDNRLPEARSQFGPTLSYEATYGYQRDNFEVLPGAYVPRSGWTSTAAAILTQPLYTFGRSAAGERSAIAQINFERSLLRQAEVQAFFDTISAYIGVIRDRTGVAIAQDNLALLEREFSDNSARLSAREVTSTDVQQVETRLELGRAQLKAAQRDAASSEADFLDKVGALPGELSPPDTLAVPVRTLEEAYAYAETHNPVIAAAYSRERYSRAQRDAARADLLPRVDLRGRAEYGTITPYSNNLRQTELRGEIVVSGTLFESGLRRARIAEAEAANDADWRLIDQALRDNRSDLAHAWNAWLALTASLDNFARAVDQAKLAYDGALLQERAGLRTTLDVLDLARELLSARTNYNSATAEAFIAKAHVMTALGALEQRGLLPDARYYDPEAHLEQVKNHGDIPLITPLLKAVDGVSLGSDRDRSARDNAAGIKTSGVNIPVPPR